MKISNRNLIAGLVVMITSLASIAQTNTPYSMYGYGILRDRATSTQRQMGGVGYAMRSGRQVNAMNPASYAYIDSLTFLFDMGVDFSVLHSSEGTARETSLGGGLDYITLQFPIGNGKYFGGSLGLVPFSSVGYSFGKDIAHGARQNQGTGGINEAYLGLSGKIAGFSLGVNVSYDFGNIVNDVYATPTGGSQTLFKHVMEISDWNIVAGLQYGFTFNRWNTITLGATYSPKKTLLGNSWMSQQALSQDSKPDTVGTLKLKNNYFQPNSYGAGIAYKREHRGRLIVEADFTFQQWSDAKFSPMYNEDGDKLLFRGMDFSDRLRYAIGSEYVPNLRGKYFERATYRLGTFFTDDYININGHRMMEYGIDCGIGLPVPDGKTIINIGFEWRHRGTSDKNLLAENHFNITLGVNFNELWFWQRKIK